MRRQAGIRERAELWRQGLLNDQGDPELVFAGASWAEATAAAAVDENVRRPLMAWRVAPPARSA